MNKKILTPFLLLVTVFCIHAQSSINGVWDMVKDKTNIEITEASGISTGKVISSDNANVKGKILLKEVKKVGNEWKGKLFAPKMGKWMDAVITRKENLLKVKVKSGMFSKTLEWNKI